MDLAAKTLDLLVDDAELERRRAGWTAARAEPELRRAGQVRQAGRLGGQGRGLLLIPDHCRTKCFWSTGASRTEVCRCSGMLFRHGRYLRRGSAGSSAQRSAGAAGHPQARRLRGCRDWSGRFPATDDLVAGQRSLSGPRMGPAVLVGEVVDDAVDRLVELGATAWVASASRCADSRLISCSASSAAAVSRAMSCSRAATRRVASSMTCLARR